MVNVEVRKNKEGYELNLNTLIYSELLMSNVRFLVTNQICRVLPWKMSGRHFFIVIFHTVKAHGRNLPFAESRNLCRAKSRTRIGGKKPGEAAHRKGNPIQSRN